MYLALVCTVALSLLIEFGSSVNNFTHDYCVIGAGPSGLQMGFFLTKASRDYVIFERGSSPGTFFKKYPRHRKLISINKRNTGKTNKEFNLRHDWNSLISDDESLLMKYYSKEFFPPADAYIEYLKDYATKLKLNVQYNTDIKKISKDMSGMFHLKDQNETDYQCKYMIICTGVAVENVPTKFKGVEHTEGYGDISVNPDDYEGQTVLILGRGNSAFETADSIMGATNLIHMLGRSRVRLAWATHYVGDLRAINNGLLDTYQLKSLDAVLEAPVSELAVIKKGDKLYVDVYDGTGKMFNQSNLIPDNFALREPYDRIIRCLGFKWDNTIFDSSTQPKDGRKKLKKYPLIKPDYESVNVQDMFFAGTISHSLDWRKSAGAFIHGFRYTARSLHHILEQKYHSVKWPSVRLPVTELMNNILKRINEASGIYQMFGVLCDVVIFYENEEFEYFEEFPVKLVDKFAEYTGASSGPMLVINMEYGKNFSGPLNDPFRDDRATGEPSEAHQSNFLHPVLYFYNKPVAAMTKQGLLPKPNKLHHIVEDFITLWNAPSSHILPLRRFLEGLHNQDLRNYFDESCFKMMMMHGSAPRSCMEFYMNGQTLPGTELLLQTALNSDLLYRNF